ncbi:MAG: lysine--tRNA ligase [Candidatus Thorarchaeota archaeon]|nr:lysine--tRNA ligase [Candidatus Thorarchaeota archaeon]
MTGDHCVSDEASEFEYSIHWINDLLERVLEREADEYIVSTGKSISGSIPISFYRELIIADVIKRKLLEAGKKTRTLFVADDYDPVRSFPSSVSLSLDEWLGIPYSKVPDEFGCCESFGAHATNEFIKTFPEFGVSPEVVWQSKLYESGKMQEATRICLRNTETIREILIEYVARDFNDAQKADYLESMKNWFPASVFCPSCGRIQAGAKGEIVVNRITGYDPVTDKVSFSCPSCGHSDEVSLNELQVKLSWRIDWPAKWFVLNVTCEPAGKDHSVKGGSFDTGLEISRRVFGMEGPVKVPFEWVRIGGRDMSTSEGIVFSPKVWLSIAPPELYRYLMLTPPLERAIDLHPERIPDMVDEFDRFERTFYGLEDAPEEKMDLIRLLYPLCLNGEVSEKYVPKLPYKFAIITSQMEGILGFTTILERCEQVLKKQFGLNEISTEAKKLIPIRLNRARTWAQEFGSDRDKVEVPDSVREEIMDTITDNDRKFLTKFCEVLKGESLDDEELQSKVFETARAVGMKDKRAFVVLYRILISRKSGPRLGGFLNLLGNEWVLKRINSVL